MCNPEYHLSLWSSLTTMILPWLLKSDFLTNYVCKTYNVFCFRMKRKTKTQNLYHFMVLKVTEDLYGSVFTFTILSLVCKSLQYCLFSSFKNIVLIVYCRYTQNIVYYILSQYCLDRLWILTYSWVNRNMSTNFCFSRQLDLRYLLLNGSKRNRKIIWLTFL